MNIWDLSVSFLVLKQTGTILRWPIWVSSRPSSPVNTWSNISRMFWGPRNLSLSVRRTSVASWQLAKSPNNLVISGGSHLSKLTAPWRTSLPGENTVLTRFPRLRLCSVVQGRTSTTWRKNIRLIRKFKWILHQPYTERPMRHTR